MADAYAHAYDASHKSPELHLLNCLDRFGGALNVLGRPLGAGEMRRMSLAQNITAWYREREQAGNIVEWTNSNMQKADALHMAHRLAVEAGVITDG